jgi:mannonate dehydratase
MNAPTSLQQLMRWFGPSDPVRLRDIAQAGCSGVVSALHAIPVGAVWPLDDIKSHKEKIESENLSWTVVESLPVHEDIKTHSGHCEAYIENYRQSLFNLSRCGIEVVTYNFMPVLDWVRTDTAYILPNKAEALMFNRADYAVADLFLLKRPGAAGDYAPEEITQFSARFESMSRLEKKRLFKNILLALPGSDVPFTSNEILGLLDHYKHIDAQRLKDNLIRFLKEITPVAEEAGIKLAIHPDDPPFPVLGLPRIMSTDRDIEDVMNAVPGKANGLCFCTGSFGARAGNDLVGMVKKWGSRIYFLHLRNTRRDEEGNFMEASHLEGDADMFEIMCEVVRLMRREKRSIPMRPDHGHKMLDDLDKNTYPGYSAVGRLKGLAELRGLEYGVRRWLDRAGENG